MRSLTLDPDERFIHADFALAKTAMNQTTAFGERIADHEARIEGLERSADRMDISIIRVADKIDGLKGWMIGILATSAGSLALFILSLLSQRK